MVASNRLCLVAFSLGLSAIATPVAANTITYHWGGIIDQIDPGNTIPGVALGKKIKIDLTLEDAVSDTDPSPEIGQYDAAFSPPLLVLDVDIGGYSIVGDFQSATVFNDHNGIDSFEVDTGRPFIGTVFAFEFSTSNLGVLTSDAIPLSLNPGDFDLANFFVQGDGRPGFSGRIVSSVPGTVPLPGSVGLLVSALTGLVGAGWWKARRLETHPSTPEHRRRS